MKSITGLMIAVGIASVGLIKNYTLLEALLVGEIGYLGIVLGSGIAASRLDDVGGIVAGLLLLVIAAVEGAVNLALMIRHHRIAETNVIDLISQLKA